MRALVPTRLKIASLLAPMCGLCAGVAHAQSLSPSISGSIGDSFAQDTAISGLDSTFGGDAASIQGSDTHTDVSDPTHAQLLGSALTPMASSYVNSTADTTPLTYSLSDAQLAAQAGTVSSGGHRSQAFVAGASASVSGAAMAGRQAAVSSLGTSSMQAAFGGVTGSKAAFSGQSAPSSAAPNFSGEMRGGAASFPGQTMPGSASGVGSPGMAQLPPNAASSMLQAGGSPGFYATDPVLTGQSDLTASLQLGNDAPTPSAETGVFFAEPSTLQAPQFQYDDGQTAPLPSGPRAGQVIGTSPEYMASTTGFSDSTRGTAALPTELSNATSPLERSAAGFGASPFRSLSDGLSFAVPTGVTPSLHQGEAESPVRTYEAFAAYERRAQQQRILRGATVSEADSMRREDIRNYQQGRYGRSSRPSRSSSLNDTAPRFETTYHGSIR